MQCTGYKHIDSIQQPQFQKKLGLREILLFNEYFVSFWLWLQQDVLKRFGQGQRKAEKLHKKKNLEEQQDRGSLINTHIYKLQNNFRIRIINIKLWKFIISSSTGHIIIKRLTKSWEISVCSTGCPKSSAFMQDCIKNRHDFVMEITQWAQEHLLCHWQMQVKDLSCNEVVQNPWHLLWIKAH